MNKSAKKPKELSTIEIHRAFVGQLMMNLNRFVGNCQRLDVDSPSAFKELKGYAEEFVGDVQHYIGSFNMTDNSFAIKDGKIAKRGNQSFLEEQNFFLENAPQTDKTKKRPFISYKAFTEKIIIVNNKRYRNGRSELKEIASSTYELWKKQFI
jgi:hypothetical protein